MNEEEISAKKIIGAILTILLTFAGIGALIFFTVAGLTWIICWGFDKVWSWKVAIGSTVLMALVVVTLKVGNS